MKLQTKTTLLTAAITLIVLATGYFLNSRRVITLLLEEQKDRARFAAASLAEHFSHEHQSYDDEHLLRLVGLMKEGRQNTVSIHLWQVELKGLVRGATTEAQSSPQSLPAEVQQRLMAGQPTDFLTRENSTVRESQFHALVPARQNGQITGAVEVIDRLSDLPPVAGQYAQDALWLALLAVLLITLVIWLFFGRVRRITEQMLTAMTQAREGNLDVQLPVSRTDEIGQITREFNLMLGRLRLMSAERESHRLLLSSEVRTATMQLKQRNQQLEATNQELWQTSRKLMQLERLTAAGQTVAQVAHEVGTPLNLISCHMQLMKDEIETAPQSAQARINIIAEQVDRIEYTVREMLDRTRSERVELIPLDLNALIVNLCAANAPTLEKHKVICEKIFDPALPYIAGDADRLQQLFVNLLNNALDAMPAGGVLRIGTRFEPAPGARVLAELMDTGCGMHKEKLARIFDPLYTTRERGCITGPELVVVRQVMQEHGGEVEVVSSPGAGTCFRLIFPLPLATSNGH